MLRNTDHEEYLARRARLGIAPVPRPVVKLPPPPKPVIQAPQPYDVAKQRDWILIRSPLTHNADIHVGSVVKSSSFIIHFTAKEYGVSVAEIKGQARTKMIVKARHEVCYRLSKEAGLSTTQIGKILGKRDHSTITHAIQRHEMRILNPNLDDIPMQERNK